MRFVDVDGTIIDVYQATSQMTDESGQTFPFTINTLLDNALGPQGYYGAFTANFHTDQSLQVSLMQPLLRRSPVASPLCPRSRCSRGSMAVMARHSALSVGMWIR